MEGVRVVARPHRDQLGEGPLWCPGENALYWTDILGRQVNRLSLADEAVTSWHMPEMIGWVIERAAAPGFIAGFQSGFARLALDPVTIEPIADPEPGLPGNRLNDAKADSAGRIWAGTMPVDADRPTGALYRLDPNGAVRQVDRSYTVANGPAISPDERWFYHTDSKAGVIYRFGFDASTGTLTDRAPFIEFAQDWGSPDGMTVDRDGGLWVAHWGGGRVSRFHPDGTLDRAIALPASQITSCTFAGPGLDRMFVTSAAVGCGEERLAGALFEVEPDATGLPPGRYAG